MEWDELFGIPRETDDIDFPHNPYTTHFYFEPKANEDPVSGQHDVAVGRWGDWHHGVRNWCHDLDADCRRSHADSDDGFRLVQGSVPETEIRTVKINSELLTEKQMKP